MKKITFLLLLVSISTAAFAYDYLLSDNGYGSFYDTADMKLPETVGVSYYWYDTTLGGINMFEYTDGSVVTMDSLAEHKLTCGSGDDSQGGVWGPWDDNKRLDVVFDLGKIFNITKAEIRSYGLVDGNLGLDGVESVTVRCNIDSAMITDTPELTGWSTVGTQEDLDHEFVPNYICKKGELQDPADPNSYEVIPVKGRYVWFEIHGLAHQVQVSELAVWGDLIGLPQNCEELWSNGQGDPADLNHDCKIDIQDIAYLTLDWLKCNKPEDPECDLVWY